MSNKILNFCVNFVVLDSPFHTGKTRVKSISSFISAVFNYFNTTYAVNVQLYYSFYYKQITPVYAIQSVNNCIIPESYPL